MPYRFRSEPSILFGSSIVASVGGSANEFLIDFGEETGGRVPPAPYNNFSNPTVGLTTGSTLQNIISTNYASSSIDMEVVSSFTKTNGNQRGLEGDSNAPFDWAAVRDGYEATGGDIGTIRFSNLNSEKVYDFSIFGARGFIGGTSSYEARGQNTESVTLLTQDNGLNNTYLTAEIQGISPNASNQIDLETIGYINAMKMTVRDAPSDIVYSPTESFAYYWEYTEAESQYTTSVGDGNGPYFVAAPQLNPNNVGSANGPELFSNDISGIGSGNGWRVVSDAKGIELKGENEISLKMRMHTGGDEDGLSLDESVDTGPDYIVGVVVTWRGGTNNDMLNKFNGHEFKWESSRWKFNGPFTDFGNTSGTIENDAGTNWPVDRDNYSKYFLGAMRNSEGRNFTTWTAPISGGTYWIQDNIESNTVSKSTEDGVPLYLVDQASLKGNGDDQIEIYLNEQNGGDSGTILHAFFWEVLDATGSISTSRGRMKEFYEYAVNRFS